MTASGRDIRKAATAVVLHGLALAILLWPIVGLEFVPMVDLPGHLAITRVLDDVLHGKYRGVLHTNVDPIYKPTYVVLYGLFVSLPKPMVGGAAVGLLIALCYAAVCHGIAALGKRRASSPLVVVLAVVVSMLCYSSAFFWGLIPFLFSVPCALVAYAYYLMASGIVDRDLAPPKSTTVLFIFWGVATHVVHPLASLFLGMMLAASAVATLALDVLGRKTSAPMMARVYTVGWPIVVWAGAVVVVHLLAAPARHELDVSRSTGAILAPFHGLTAARAFLAQIPIELGLVPTRNAASTVVRYPIAVAVFFAVGWAIACVAALAARRAPAPAFLRRPIVRLVAVLILSATLVLFIRHDIIRVTMGGLWFPVRAPAFLVFFFGVLAAAILVRALDGRRLSGLVSAVIAVCGLGLALERSAVLRTHFVEFDAKVRGFFRGEVTERYLRAQPVSYGDHIRTYNCYFDDAADRAP
jgi:hypothetical protein